jgi:starch phosphorylase
MVKDYVARLYTPAGKAAAVIADDDYAAGRELAKWKQEVRKDWSGVQVLHVESGGLTSVPRVGDELHVRARVQLGGLEPEDVAVQVVYGKSIEGDALEDTTSVELVPLVEDMERPTTGAITLDGSITFAGTVTLTRPGSFGYNVRVVPKSPYLASPAELGLVTIAH